MTRFEKPLKAKRRIQLCPAELKQKCRNVSLMQEFRSRNEERRKAAGRYKPQPPLLPRSSDRAATAGGQRSEELAGIKGGTAELLSPGNTHGPGCLLCLLQLCCFTERCSALPQRFPDPLIKPFILDPTPGSIPSQKVKRELFIQHACSTALHGS